MYSPLDTEGTVPGTGVDVIATRRPGRHCDGIVRNPKA